MTSHLLLIEDDEVAAYVTCGLLKASGFSVPVDVVRDGMEALAYLNCEASYADRNTGNPLLILLDLKLPDLDGFELFKRIRSNPVLSVIPIFILSASSADEDVCRGALLGVSKYLTKPLNMQEFRAEAAKIVNAPQSLH
jgi:DNA-binding response OmpR family regulator